MRRMAVVAAVVAGLGLATARPSTQARPAIPGTELLDGRPVVTGEVLVKLHATAGPADFGAIARLADADLAEPLGQAGIRRLRSRSQSTRTLLARLAGHPGIAYVEPNFLVTALAEPGDPLMPYLWGLRNTGQAVNGGIAGQPGADVNAIGAWDVSIGSDAHVVAVIDTGLDYTHPDLAANVWSAPAPFTVTIAGVPVTCPAGSHGFNAIARTCDPMDDHHHGTHVAGTIAAAAGNGIGVAGVNWTADVMGVKFLNAAGSGTIADAINAIDFVIQARMAFAATGGADVRVLSNSWGGREYSQALADEIAVAGDHAMLFVAAAGNDGLNNDIFPVYPASYPAPNVVSVAATTNTDGRAWFSNYGAVSVDLGAPGVDILSTTLGGTYGFASGTSMATPHVSGAAALVLSRCDLGAPALKATLLATAEQATALATTTVAGGRLDVGSALRSCVAPPEAPSNLTATAGNGVVALAWSGASGALSFTVKRGVASGGPYVPIAAGVTARAYSDTSVVNDTLYYYVVSAGNTLGESGDSAEASAMPKAPSDLVVSALSVPSESGAGLAIVVSESTRNQGAGGSAPTTTRFFLSRNTLVDATDTLLAESHAVPALSPGAASEASTALVLPASAGVGLYFVIARADADGIETESGEANNNMARSLTLGPDLAATSLTVPATAAAGAEITVSAAVTNRGGGVSGVSTARFYLSANIALDAGDVPLPGGLPIPALPPDGVASGSAAVGIPAATATGSYYLLAKADADGIVPESAESNNTAARLIKIGGDLTVSSLTVPSRAGAGMPLIVGDTTSNPGAGGVATSTTRFYLSANSLLDASDRLLAGGRAVPPLASGASSAGSTSVPIPSDVATGTYFVIGKADADGLVAETQEGNNTSARSIAVGPDLTVPAFTVPFAVVAGADVVVDDTVLNQGAGAAAPTLTRFYLSLNGSVDASDVQLEGSRLVPGLGAGESSAGSTLVTIPVGVTPGTYYVIARADAGGAVTETSEGNNVRVRVVKVSAAP